MRFGISSINSVALFSSVAFAIAIPTEISVSTPLSVRNSQSSSPENSTCSYWYEEIKHQGLAPFSGDSSYKVFRDVKEFGAIGDGKHDDTAAINLAISSGGRCAPGVCNSTSTTPATVYFPSGTYLVSAPIIDYYYTNLVGNPNCRAIIKTSKGFEGAYVIDGDEYLDVDGVETLGYGATNIFWRQVRNLVIDMTALPVSKDVAGVHWPTGQATSLTNMRFLMSSAPGTQHQGVYIESGSGGYLSDLFFDGGKWGMNLANQQFTMRNLHFQNSVTAILQQQDWSFAYKAISITNCSIGINMSASAVGSITLFDSSIKDTTVGILTSHNATKSQTAAGSLVVENVSMENVGTMIRGPSGAVVAGSAGQTTLNFIQGHAYTLTGISNVSTTLTANPRPAILTNGGESFYMRSKPQYHDQPVSKFVSVRSSGAVGDGVTDDTNAINAILTKAARNGQIVFFDAGDYLVTKTIFIPPGAKIVGDASFPVILSSGSYFSDMTNPKPVIQVGVPGAVGVIEWSNMIISTKGSQGGAILIEYNLASSASDPAGMWDIHTRIGGFTGSDLQVKQCLKKPNETISSLVFPTNCIAAFMSMHITKQATGLYMENNWFWTADHDVDDADLTQITIYSGRGLLIESVVGGIWLYASAVEHHSLFQYHLSGTNNIYMGQIQTETPYYQPNPDALRPFTPEPLYNDPIYKKGESALGLLVQNSQDISVYGAGFYSFFSNYNVSCSTAGVDTCQGAIFGVDAVSGISLYNLITVGTKDMITKAGKTIATYGQNNGGFIAIVALFRSLSGV